MITPHPPHIFTTPTWVISTEKDFWDFLFLSSGSIHILFVLWKKEFRFLVMPRFFTQIWIFMFFVEINYFRVGVDLCTSWIYKSSVIFENPTLTRFFFLTRNRKNFHFLSDLMKKKFTPNPEKYSWRDVKGEVSYRGNWSEYQLGKINYFELIRKLTKCFKTVHHGVWTHFFYVFRNVSFQSLFPDFFLENVSGTANLFWIPNMHLKGGREVGGYHAR